MWCKSRRFDCILLVSFRRWSRLVMCDLIKHDSLLWLVVFLYLLKVSKDTYFCESRESRTQRNRHLSPYTADKENCEGIQRKIASLVLFYTPSAKDEVIFESYAGELTNNEKKSLLKSEMYSRLYSHWSWISTKSLEKSLSWASTPLEFLFHCPCWCC